MTGEPSPSCTLTPAVTVGSPAWVSFGPDVVEARLRAGSVKRFRVGTDVDELRLSTTADGEHLLDLLRQGRPAARLRSAVWAFDASHGPAEAAAATRLPLRRDDEPPTAASPLLVPGAYPAWMTLVSVVVLVCSAVVLLAGIGGVALVWLAAVGTLVALPRTLRVLQLERSIGGRPAYTAAPTGDVSRAATEARLIEHGRHRWFAGARCALTLPPRDDACAPARLVEVVVTQRRPAKRFLQVRSDDGYVLASLAAADWTDGRDRSATDLAAAIGVPLADGPAEPVEQSPRVFSSHLGVHDNRWAVQAFLAGVLALLLGWYADGALATATAAFGGVTAVAALVQEVRATLVDRRARRRVVARSPATTAGRPDPGEEHR